MIYNANCLDVLIPYEAPVKWDVIFADPPDGIGLGYNQYDDRSELDDYKTMVDDWLSAFCYSGATCIWVSFNSRWTLTFARAVSKWFGSDWEFKPCVQTFTFGQHNHHDLGNNHRPLWRLRRKSHPLFPDRVRVPSWRQLNGDKRADPRGRVPGDVMVGPHVTGCLPKAIPNLTTNDIERFLSKLDKKGDNDCWNWTAGTVKGYGKFKIRDKGSFFATRLMWRLFHGTDPGESVVCHACDNPSCCNPNHLFLGTNFENSQDMVRKGRSHKPKGMLHPHSKLTDKDVAEIYVSELSSKMLAEEYGVTQGAINHIRSDKTWTHITGDIKCSDVFRIPRVTGNSKERRSHHPTQLAESLVERCLLLTCPDGARVLDPFGGTGTTLRVCKKLGIDCDLIELDSEYCERIREEHPEQEIVIV